MDLAHSEEVQNLLLVVVQMQKHVTTMLMQFTTMVLVQRMMSVVFVAVTVSLMEHVIVTVTYLTP